MKKDPFYNSFNKAATVLLFIISFALTGTAQTVGEGFFGGAMFSLSVWYLTETIKIENKKD